MIFQVKIIEIWPKYWVKETLVPVTTSRWTASRRSELTVRIYIYRLSSAAWHLLILTPNYYTFPGSQVVICSCGEVNIEYHYCHSLNFQVGKLAENTFKYQCLGRVHIRWGSEVNVGTDFLQSWDVALAIQKIQFNMPRKKHLIMQCCVEFHCYGNTNWYFAAGDGRSCHSGNIHPWNCTCQYA